MFGMGTGVSPPVRSPETWKSSQQLTVYGQQLKRPVLSTVNCSLNGVASVKGFVSFKLSVIC